MLVSQGDVTQVQATAVEPHPGNRAFLRAAEVEVSAVARQAVANPAAVLLWWDDELATDSAAVGVNHADGVSVEPVDAAADSDHSLGRVQLPDETSAMCSVPSEAIEALPAGCRE